MLILYDNRHTMARAIQKIWDSLHSVSHLAAREQAVEVRQGQPKKESNHDNVMNTSEVKQGNGSEYLLRRLAKTAGAWRRL